MPWKMRWLGAIGVVLLATGAYPAFARRTQFYPGLVFMVGCACCAVFLLINHPAWSRCDPRATEDP